ncbi:hypothetical protein B0H63DRAFT_284641 [Podospora didyma]|uniref:Uncharacterized protein n=1 Tax=Podospora didyma TaxID=330526 RepID=A0AAE0K9F1_9PEZI|nr:hypothetical protein B0H63DRAFT_284641 [Podospora didyma]
MDGSYGNVFPAGRSMSPSNPGSGNDQYKVNVSRQKTRKWANFKPQNYDGDDWGDDYNDDEEGADPAPAPGPPLKPMGPREPSAPSPTARQFQPTSPPPLHIPNQASRQAQVETGSPFVSGAPSIGAGPERRGTGNTFAQSAATASSVYSNASPYGQRSGSPAAIGSPVSRNMTATPPTAASVPSRFPLRKSSMGAQDAPTDSIDLIRQAGSSQTGNVKPVTSPLTSPTRLPFVRPADIYKRMEQEKEKERRSLESGRASMDSNAGRGTSERVEEQKQSQLPSQEPAPAPAPAPTPAQVQPQTQKQTLTQIRPQQEGADQKWQPSAPASATPTVTSSSTIRGAEKAADLHHKPRPSLASVAERKSEYGLEGLIDSYGSDEPGPPTVPSIPAANSTTMGQTQSSVPAPVPQEMQPPAKPNRISTSPMLPEFSRLSDFGEDFFSPARSSTSSHPQKQQSELSSVAQEDMGSLAQPTVERDEPISSSSSAAALPVPSSPTYPPPPLPPPPHAAISTSAAVPETESEGLGQVSPRPNGSSIVAEPKVAPPQQQAAIRSPSPPSEARQTVLSSFPDETGSGTKEPFLANSQSRGPGTDGQLDAMLATENKRPFRPHLPGGWVSETPTTPWEVPTPAVQVDDRYSPTPEPAASANLSSVAEPESKDMGGSFLRAGEYETSDGPSEASTAKQPILEASSRPPSPRALSPLVIASPALSTSLQTIPGPTVPQGGAGTSYFENAQPAELTSPEPATATTQTSEIPPTAPLNPRRDPKLEGILDFIPHNFSGNSTLDTTSSSPLKESDMLRDEIIKSLSPLQPSNEFNEFAGKPNTAVHLLAAEPGRESTYLGDVYGDYWADDDKPSQGPLVAAKQEEAAKAPDSETLPRSSVEQNPVAPLGNPAAADPLPGSEMDTAPKAQPSTARPGPAPTRFSWERNSERHNNAGAPSANAENKDEKQAVDPKANNVVIAEPALAPAAVELPAVSVTRDAGHLSPDPAELDSVSSSSASGGISHQVSQASTLQPKSTLEAPIEPPSPLSVLSDRNGHLRDAQKPAVSDEKIPVQGLSNVASPLAPEIRPPTIAKDQQFQPTSGLAMAQASAHPAFVPKKDPVNIVAFKQILAMPSQTERIKYFNETRSQFAVSNTGLEEWMQALRSKHPEHTGAGWSFRTEFQGATNVAPDAQPPGPHAPGQAAGPAPYFQQYGNASSPTVNQGARPANNIPMPPPPQHGGHSSNQVGTKSKELLKSAGKAGKGLLSKGKNKLRGATGDKVFFNS